MDPQEIYRYYKQLETEQRVSANMVSSEHRRRLVTWINEASEELDLKSNVYFVAVAILDHFLDRYSILESELGIVGAACLGMAAKYEEEDYGLSELSFVSGHSKAVLVEVEWTILQTLNFNLGFVTPEHFFDYFWGSVEFTQREKHASQWMLELAVTDADIVSKYLPSEITASVIYLTRMLGGVKPIWSPSLEQITEYPDQSLHPCLKALIARLRREAMFVTPSFISTKYEDPSRSKASVSVLSFYRKY